MKYVYDTVWIADMARKLRDFRDRVMEESEKNELTIKHKKTMFSHQKDKKPNIRVANVNIKHAQSLDIWKVF